MRQPTGVILSEVFSFVAGQILHTQFQLRSQSADQRPPHGIIIFWRSSKLDSILKNIISIHFQLFMHYIENIQISGDCSQGICYDLIKFGLCHTVKTNSFVYKFSFIPLKVSQVLTLKSLISFHPCSIRPESVMFSTWNIHWNLLN